MEVEFLQNMKYNLFTSEVAWREWQIKLHRFWIYWNTASQTIFSVSPKTSGPISPALPSPPASQIQSPGFIGTTQSPIRTHSSQVPHVISDAIPQDSVLLTDNSAMARKRSYDAGSFVMEPPPKRVTRSMAPNISVSIPQFPMHIPSLHTAPARHNQRESPPLAPIALGTSNLSIPSIPPANFGLTLPEPGSRAMSMVFPSQAQAGITTPNSAPAISVSSIGPASRTSSPYLHPISNSSSPSSAYPPQQPQHLSPSYFLGNRSSPYRPVRGVHSLLIPQPQAPAPPPMSLDQIQYQPLAKTRNQCRNGVLPYMSTEVAWGPSTYRPAS